MPAQSRSLEPLPHAYGESRIVAMARDPHWAYAYWEITAEALQEARERVGLVAPLETGAQSNDPLETGAQSEDSRLTLRIHPAEEGQPFDIEVYHRIGTWYIEFWSSGKSYWIEIGLKSRRGAFASIARSNLFFTPTGALSWRTDEEWLEVGDDGDPKVVTVEGPQGVPTAQIERMALETEAAVSSWFVRPA